MIDPRKEYLIKIYIKKGLIQFHNMMKITFDSLHATYPDVSMEKVIELKKRYTSEEYTKRIIPIIDEQFSLEEVEELIKFYTNGPGKKILDPIFMQNVEKMGINLFEEIHQQFALNS